MEAAPLALKILHISPLTLIPTWNPDATVPIPPIPLPSPPPPAGFSFSPTPNYPPPFGSISLGSKLDFRIGLENVHRQRHGVHGVRMMTEVQSASGRVRLGEAIHGQMSDTTGEPPLQKGQESQLPELKFGEMVELQVESEMKDLGLGVMIVSVAWETLDGRKTFQRFFKFNIITPLGIKTRVQIASHPNSTLSLSLRKQTYLEVFMQNASLESMLISGISLEPVEGLKVNKIGGSQMDSEELSVGGTRQYLFVAESPPNDDEIAKQDKSTFPPTYPAGAVLPLGRLLVEWISGPYHTPGKLLTSMLNRRAPAPRLPSITQPQPTPTRTLSAAPPTPIKAPTALDVRSRTLATPRRGLSPNPDSISSTPLPPPSPKWEFDLTLTGSRNVPSQSEWYLTFSLAVRSATPILDPSEEQSAPTLPRLGIQYLTPVEPSLVDGAQLERGQSRQSMQGNPQMMLSPPSRTSTPASPSPSSAGRPLSPFTTTSTASTSIAGISGMSRPTTPLRAELKSAVGSMIGPNPFASPLFKKIQNVPNDEEEEKESRASFPPTASVLPNPDYKPSTSLDKSAAPVQIYHVGSSLIFPVFPPLTPKFENRGPRPLSVAGSEKKENESQKVAKKYWETSVQWQWKFVGFDEGLGVLGGARVLIFEGEDGGVIGQEWDCLGDITVS
ncbi:hypothetical protein I314_02309 [Cryptococcus bacillisporus CA1873]|uniref:DUF974-domain-containing protein n=1 Tax=Cryptococcus bacillisporus CA1873 TaxID=1296111 RepID=A0ABR5BD41_CRYGA|nr:hypothetical protein I314_02309 [Cryptococcus bacillisporus CA1873]|eukprot:KIR67096.1 hypothetical protein I314_02309 [Cryptococcus gattii CA1873]